MYKKYIKRLLDIILSLLGLIIASPIFLIVSLLVLIFLGYPIIFKQKRPGKDEKIFTLYKFRTMTDKKDKDGNLLPDEQRLTKFGKFLRKTSLDELPEFINILKGDMSFVGPRPLLVEYLPYYTKKEHHRHDVRPGLTGLAQINGRNSLKWDNRFKRDIEYIYNLTFMFDIKILLLTIKKILFKEDIQMGDELKFRRLDVEREKSNNIGIIQINSNYFDNHSDEIYECIYDLKNNSKASRDLFDKMRKFLNENTALVYVATINNKVKGFIWGYFIDNKTIHINYFDVLLYFRHFGIGSKLLDKILNDYKNNKFELLVRKDNNIAIRLYENFGFKKTNYNDEKFKMTLER